MRKQLLLLLGAQGHGFSISVGQPPALVQIVGGKNGQFVDDALLLCCRNHFAKPICMGLHGGGNFNLRVLCQIAHLALPHPIGAGLYFVQLKAQTTLAYDPKKSGLHLFELFDVCHATHFVEERHLAGHLNFTSFLNPCHAKGQFLLLAPLDEIKVTHFKNLKREQSIGEDAL